MKHFREEAKEPMLSNIDPSDANQETLIGLHIVFLSL